MTEVRDRLGNRITTSRLRLEAQRAAGPIGVLLVAGALALLGLWWTWTHVDETAGRGTYTVRFEVADAFGVVPGVNDFRYRGVPAGTITKVERTDGKIVVSAKIRTAYGPVYRDARAELRPVTPLEDFYLDVVDPGTRAAGRAGDRPLRKGQTDTSVHVGDVLNTLRGTERARLQTLLDQLGNGSADRGVALRRSFAALQPFIVGAGQLTAALAERRAATRRLIHNAAVLTTELGRRQRQLRTLVEAGSATLGTLQEGSSDLDATLRQLPPSLRAIRSSFAAVRAVLDDVDRGVGDLYPALDELPAALKSIRALNASLGPAVAALQRPVADLVPLVTALVPVSSDLSETFSALRPQVGAVDKVTTDLAKCKRAVQGFFQWDASIAKFADNRGPVPRGNLVFTRPAEVAVPGVGLRRPVGESCTPGVAIGGRPTEPRDKR